MPSLTINQAIELATQKHQSGHLAEARSLYSQILSHDPNQADALHLLGLLTWQEGDGETALKLIHKAIQIHPNNAAYLGNLGIILRQMGRFDDAVRALREALRFDPMSATSMAHLGAIYLSRGKLDEAIENFRNAVAAAGPRGKLQAARWQSDLGVALAQSDRLAEAVAALEIACRMDPAFAEPHANIGLIMQRLGRLEEGISACQRAVEIQPACAGAFNTLGIILSQQGHGAEAVVALRKAITLLPLNMNGYVNLAQTLATLGEMDAAIETCQAGLKVSPGNGAIYQVLGCVHRDIGQLGESLAAFDRAIELDPRDRMAHSGRIFSRHFHSGSDQREQAADLRLWNERHGRPFREQRKHENDPNPDRPLRIGYVSPDFTGHVLALTMLSLFSSHDRSAIESHFYSNVLNPGPVTQKFRDCAHRWTDVVGESDQQLADRIRRDQIDILVDLTMHMPGNRLQVFARKPAPVQVTWAAYPGSTGLTAIDYRITDPYLDPPGMFDEFYSEESIRLPDTYWCYDPMTDGPAVNETPAASNGFITFGCLNNFCKVSSEAIGIWVQILRSVPDSRMMFLCQRGSHRQRVMNAFTDHGIAAHRVEMIERLPRPQYLELYHRVDISLDPLPYNGHTTSLDSLWMGVPLVTLVGKTVVGRAGFSQLTNLGLSELIAENAEQYIELIRNLSSDIERLKLLRGSLRKRMEQSPLMDKTSFARNFEAAYRQMWRRWCEQR